MVAKKADLVFLCLPDVASKEIMAAIGDFPYRLLILLQRLELQLVGHMGSQNLVRIIKQILQLKTYCKSWLSCERGMIACIAPLVKAGLVPADYPFTITSLTGYSGGGKKMIGQYESSPKDYFLYAPRQYGLGQEHKHLPEVTTCMRP